ncbi:MAG: PKD domain-containing protein [Chitinophagales bacterium]|nr:PKD domain-containing protein [Chitinophagales bacterium]
MKKRIKSIAVIVLLTLAFASCKKDSNPVACFTVDKTTINAGETINFNANCSTDTFHWEWDFGDGANGEGTTLSHTYNNAGTYTVMLAAHNEDMTMMDDAMQTITVN